MKQINRVVEDHISAGPVCETALVMGRCVKQINRVVEDHISAVSVCVTDKSFSVKQH